MWHCEGSTTCGGNTQRPARGRDASPWRPSGLSEKELAAFSWEEAPCLKHSERGRSVDVRSRNTARSVRQRGGDEAGTRPGPRPLCGDIRLLWRVMRWQEAGACWGDVDSSSLFDGFVGLGGHVPRRVSAEADIKHRRPALSLPVLFSLPESSTSRKFRHPLKCTTKTTWHLCQKVLPFPNSAFRGAWEWPTEKLAVEYCPNCNSISERVPRFPVCQPSGTFALSSPSQLEQGKKGESNRKANNSLIMQ